MELSEVLDLLNKRVKYPHQLEMLKRHEDVYYDMSLHTLGACPAYDVAGRTYYPSSYYGVRYQDRFNFCLLNRHPRESCETHNWRLSRYKPLTKAPFQTVTELVTGAIFQDGNYSIEIPDKEDADYIWGNNFHGYNLIGYFASIGYKHMIEDPNGVFVRMPKKPWFEYQQGEAVEVEIWFINSCYIRYIGDEDLVFEYKGYAWHIDKQTIWRYEFEQEWKLADDEGYYAHMLGKLPISVARGEWNSKGYYDSFYDKARAAADIYIDVFSSQQLVDKNASHPFIIESSEECPSCHGNKQFQWCNQCKVTTPCRCPEQPSPHWSLVPCDDCGGTGTIASDPSRRKIVPADQLKDGQHVQIVSPDIGVNKHHIELCKEIMQAIKEALHLNLIDEAQSGTAKGIDQDRQYKFISKISNHMFDNLINETIGDIIAYRHVVATSTGVRPAVYEYKIIKPQQFDIKTAAMLLDDFNKSVVAKAPNYILAKQLYDFTDKQYSGDDKIKKTTAIITSIDPYFMDSADAKLSKKVAGVLTTEQWIMSDNYPLIIEDIIRQHGEEWFLDADFETIKQEIDRIKVNYIPAINPLVQGVNETLRIDA